LFSPWEQARIMHSLFHRALSRMLEGWFSIQVRGNRNNSSSQVQPPPPAGENADQNQEQQQEDQQGLQRISLDAERIRNPVRTVVGALLLPAISSLVGSFFLDGVIRHTFRRNVVGGILFIVAQDILTTMYHFYRLRRQSQRKIKDYSATAAAADDQ